MRPGFMKVKVDWDVLKHEDGERQQIIDMPAMSISEIENYLNSGYRYSVKSFEIVDLDKGRWNGKNAWLLSYDNDVVTILVGAHSINEAIEAKKYNDNKTKSKYDDCIICVTVKEWFQQQGYLKNNYYF
jgi:hypothetical protein